ncbi:MAG: excinuclease ABC subunit UvrC [candidate division WOR-3 bacterium]|nr:excinuclease ABC subunit UvrC [candidate division WOR-3 bacterium]
MLSTERLNLIPENPGVYLLKDKHGKIIYIGKSKNLRDRLRAYTQEQASFPKGQLIRNVYDFEFIETKSEVEALVLEDNLIKLNKPKFNIRLKDDKKFPYLKITVQEKYPRIFATRNLRKDGSILFGPYTNAKSLRRAINAVRNIFKIRTCRKNLPLEKVPRPCLNFAMNKCLAPCQGNILETDYRERINNVIAFLQGKSINLEQELESKMKQAAAREDFETAATFRDQLLALRDIIQRQEPVFTDIASRDIIGLAVAEAFVKEPFKTPRSYANATLIKVRDGKIIGKENYPFVLNTTALPDEIVETLLRTVYLHTYDLPEEVIVPVSLKNKKVFIDWFKQERNKPVKIYCPRSGIKKRLLQLANTDANIGLSEIMPVKKVPQPLLELYQLLNLKEIPKIIEAVDVSNISGTFATGSIVVFTDGYPNKKEYRMFRIRTVQGPNDYAMIEEVLTRRIASLIAQKKTLPDLVLIDGGKGQLSSAVKAYANAPKPIPLLAFAKRTDTLYYNDGREITIPAYSPALKLLKRIRDEAHRFAIKYHKKLRGKKLIASALDDIVGIGPKRKQILIKHFGSLDKIKQATIEEIAQLKGFNQKIAEQIKQQLNTQLE